MTKENQHFSNELFVSNQLFVSQDTVPVNTRFRRIYLNLKSKIVAFKSSKIVLFVQNNKIFFKIIFIIVLILILNTSPHFVKLVRADDDFKIPKNAPERWLKDRGYEKYLDKKKIVHSAEKLQGLKEWQDFIRRLHADQGPKIRRRPYEFMHYSKIDCGIRDLVRDPSRFPSPYNNQYPTPYGDPILSILEQQKLREEALSFFNKYIFPQPSIVTVGIVVGLGTYVIVRECFFPYKD